MPIESPSLDGLTREERKSVTHGDFWIPEEEREKYKEADANRFVLLAQLKRAGARESQASTFSSGVDPFSEMSRMEERIWQDADYISALDELDDRPAPPPSVDQSAVEERLRELKRQLGRE